MIARAQTLSRLLALLPALVCAFALGAGPADAQAPAQPQVVAKIGSVAPEGTPWAEWINGWKTRVDADAKGGLKVKVFLAGKLGGEKEMVEDTKKGVLHIFGGSVGALASQHVPELNVFELPFLFSSDAEADFVMSAVRADVKKLLESRGFVMLMWGENGWHGYGIKGKCVEKPEDLKGLKMRSQESQIHLETYRAFGASPVELPVPEVMSALQTGAVDGFSNTPLFSQAVSWSSSVTHFTYTKHLYQPALIVASKKWYDTLTPDVQKVLSDPKEEQTGFKMVRMITEPLLQNFTDAGIKVCRLTPQQTQVFADASKKVWDIYSKKSPANKKLLDAVLAAKKSFAAQAK